MYSAIAYGIGQVLVEIPYALVQADIYGPIVYFMLKLELDAGKFFWFLYFLYFTVLFFTYYGMVAVGLTANQQIASIVATLLYVFLNIFSGFLLPYSRIPVYWKWMYWCTLTSYTLIGSITPQFEDIHNPLQSSGVNVTGVAVDQCMDDSFGFRTSLLPLAAVMMVVFPVLAASVFICAIAKLNFQRR
ncbi:hypothetical protein R1sor_012168 [Riccia sorocarpa]|uniref:ABC-2 type transporter transmembrane domain-containing protein n=1 Tax=Riccia sorocarpa TaxID=122646 RepID=A0ABD3I5Q6_9MARC